MRSLNYSSNAGERLAPGEPKCDAAFDLVLWKVISVYKKLSPQKRIQSCYMGSYSIPE